MIPSAGSRIKFLLVIAGTLSTLSVSAVDIVVSNKTQLATAQASVLPGDTIIWKNGTYDNLDTITFEPANGGTPADPITFRAETPGGVTFRGNTRLQMGGRYLVVSGFRFDNSDFNFSGTSTAGFVIASRAHSDITRHAYNSRVTDCAIINYDNPAATSSTKWVQWYGGTNRFDNNYVTGKRTRGATFIVELNTTVSNFHAGHVIEQNVFADRPADPAAANEFETVRVGTSEFSDQNARITVQSNFFYRCSGEAEIVSNKSGENSYRYNTFIECAGSLTLRHGRGCTVEGNVFFGKNVPNSGGIRVANQDHLVVNNYMQDLAGTAFQAGLVIMNGTTWNPPAASPDLSGGYVVVKDSLFAHNTIINAAQAVNFGVGSAGTPPRDNTLAANLIVSSNAPLFTLTSTPVNTTYLSNLVWGAATGLPANPNIVVADPQLATDSQGVQRPAAVGPAAGNAGTEFLLPDDFLDMDGALRPLVGRDIGADQINSGSSPVAPMHSTNVGPTWIQSTAPPEMGNQPVGQTNAVGSTISLSVTASGGIPLFFQWRKNGVNLVEGGTVAGSDERTLLISSAQLSDGGNYDVVVNNGYGAVTSAVAVVSIFTPTFPPSITSQPTNQNVVAGGNANFSVGASGTSPLSYQWYFNTTTLLSGQNGSTLNLVNVQAGDAGNYAVVVTNSYGSVTSSVATLTVQAADEPPAITAPPTSLTITAGQTAGFSVIASGTPPLSYQWFFQTNTPLSGETSSTLNIPNAQAVNAGAYSVVVTNNFGSVTSAVAILTVNPAGPANTYHWDASTGTVGIQDGTGTWSTNNANWLLNGADANVVWDNSGPNDAVFGGGISGTAGNVNIPGGSTVTVRHMTFNAPFAGAYVVNGSTPTTSILNLSGSPTVTVANGVSAELKALITGTGFTKDGPGILTLAGGTAANNIYSGLVTVNEGTLILKKNSDGQECITADGVKVNAGATLQLPKKDHINDAATVTCSGGIIQMVSSGGDTFASLVLESGSVTNSDTGTSRILTMTESIEVQSGQIAGNTTRNMTLAGTAGLTKTTPGTVIMGPVVANTYSGPTAINAGKLVVAATGAIPSGSGKGNVTVDATLDLNGTSISLNGLNGSSTGIISNGAPTSATLTVGNNSASGTYAGAITDGNGTVALTKTGSGTLTLDGVSSFSGATTLSQGTLRVNGTIAGSGVTAANGTTLSGSGHINCPATISSGGTLVAGPGIATLTLNDSLNLAAGSIAAVEINAATASSDLITGFTSATYAGSLTVANLGGVLASGQSYQIFGAGGNGSFSSITPEPGAGLNWSFDPAAGVLSVVSSVNTTPTNLTVVVNGANIEISWPQNQIGWQLQAQTNSLSVGLSTNWSAWPGSTSTNQVIVPIDPANPGVFLRLVYPPQP